MHNAPYTAVSGETYSMGCPLNEPWVVWNGVGHSVISGASRIWRCGGVLKRSPHVMSTICTKIYTHFLLPNYYIFDNMLPS